MSKTQTACPGRLTLVALAAWAARAIAPDRSQPTILRKASLNLIGRHGDPTDLTVLNLCSRERPRLSQAGKPAARTLQDRLAGRPGPVLRPS